VRLAKKQNAVDLRRQPTTPTITKLMLAPVKDHGRPYQAGKEKAPAGFSNRAQCSPICTVTGFDPAPQKPRNASRTFDYAD